MKNGLKRSSSAPLINQLVASESASGLSREGPPRQRSVLPEMSLTLRLANCRTHNYVPAAATSRWRRWSTSTSLSPVSPGSPISSQVRAGAGVGHSQGNQVPCCREQAGQGSTDSGLRRRAM